jgi:hypothetical protein
MTHSELDLLVKYADHKGGGTDGQLIIDDVETQRSRDNRIRHGIGNENPQDIEKGNKTYSFSTTTMMSNAAADALERIVDGDAEQDALYVRKSGDDGWSEQADGMVWNDVTTSASDDGDTTVSIDADLFGLDFEN